MLSITIGFIVWIICRKSEKRRVNEKIINHVNCSNPYYTEDPTDMKVGTDELKR